MEKKRFAVFLCAEDSDFVKKKYGGYFEVFIKMLSDEGEIWDIFRVASGEFPEDDELILYDGFVITGSCHDARSNEIWICRLVSLLKKIHSMKKKVLGFCFGHQILSRSIGGKTGRARKGWDIGVRTINLVPSKTLSALKIPTSLSLIECHRDEVYELPPFATILAWSEKTGIEMFRCGDHFMGIQGHPEYDKDILLDIINRLQNRNSIHKDQAESGRLSVESKVPDHEIWKKLCKSFLKGRLVL